MALTQERLEQVRIALLIRIRHAERRGSADRKDAKGVGRFHDLDGLAAKPLRVDVLDLAAREDLQKRMRRPPARFAIQRLRERPLQIELGERQTDTQDEQEEDGDEKANPPARPTRQS